MKRALALAIFLLAATPACAASPQLNTVLPRGVQRGAQLKLTLHGARLQGPQQILFYRPGIEVLNLRAKNGRLIEATVKVAPDCPLGEHPLRLRTTSGLSELRTLHVGALPVRQEAEPNQFAKAQALDLREGPGVTVAGVLTAEDVDVFAIQARAGERITAEVHAVRLGGPLVDPHLSLLDAAGQPVQVADDAALSGPDAILSWIAPADGPVFLELREASYGGAGNARYLLHVGAFPRPLAALPSGGSPGQELEVLLLGDGAERKARVTLPAQAGPFAFFEQREGGALAPSPLPLQASTLPATLETEPNQGRKRANPIQVPGVVHGRLQKPGDVDFFRFSAKKGQVFRVRARARGIGSPLDPVLTIWHADGKRRYLVANDDTRGYPDSQLRFRAPRAGIYDLRVREFLGRGGPGHVYRIELEAPRPSLTLSIQQNGRRGNQERNAVAVPRGGRFAVLATARRQGFRGALNVTTEGLPAGVTLKPIPMQAAGNNVPLVFEAAADAPLAGALVPVRGACAKPAAQGELAHAIDLCVGQPNNAVYHSVRVDRLAVAVTEPAPFSIELVPPAAPLVRGGNAQLKLRVVRRKGFTNPVHVRLLANPPGVGSRPINVAKGKTDGVLALTANGRAALGTWPIVAIARAGYRGPLWISSQVVDLQVAAPFVTAKLTRGAAAQGTKTELTAHLAVARPFTRATARLIRLPRGVTAPALQVTPETRELRFPLTIGPKAKPGRHRNIFCQLVVEADGQPVVHNQGRTDLRIDRPRKKRPPPPKGPRPASRLEQLRAEFARQAKQEAP